MKKIYFLFLGLIMLSFILSFVFYPIFPDRIATHWNADGDADGFSEKGFGSYLYPVMTLIIAVILIFLPKIDPLYVNIKTFEKSYEKMIIVFLCFMLLIQVQSIVWNMGYALRPNVVMPIGIGILFITIGDLLGKSKRNHMIGIRTPWTISSDKVWDKTHRLGKRLFIGAGIISLLGVFFGKYALYFVLIPSIISAIGCIVYSYLEFIKIENKKNVP